MIFRRNRSGHEQLKYLKGKWLDAKLKIRKLPLIVKKVTATIIFVAVLVFALCYISIKQSNNQSIEQSSRQSIAAENELQANNQAILVNSMENGIIGISAEYLSHLSSLGPIPRKIHIAWNDTNVLNSSTLVVVDGVARLKSTNLDWNYTIYGDAEIDAFIQSKIAKKDYDLIAPRHTVEKSDLWRLLIMYHEGGYYQDLDRVANVALDDLIKEGMTKMLLPTHYDHNFAQDIMCTAPGNDLFKYAIDLNLSKRRKQQHKPSSHDVKELGPTAYFQAVTHSLFNITIPEGKFVPEMREIIQKSKHIETYMEVWCDSIMYHTDDIEACKRKYHKEDLYQEIGKKQWDEEVNQEAKA